MMKTMMMMMALDMMHLMTAPGRGLMKERRMPSTRGGGVQINHAKEGKGKDKKNTTYKDKCTYTMQRIFDERENGANSFVYESPKPMFCSQNYDHIGSKLHPVNLLKG